MLEMVRVPMDILQTQTLVSISELSFVQQRAVQSVQLGLKGPRSHSNLRKWLYSDWT